jgi:hypothetical protein
MISANRIKLLSENGNICITCNDRIPHNAKIQHEDGSEIKGVMAIDIRMRPDEIVTATLDLIVDEISIEAEPLLSYRTVKEAAEHYGYKLVKEK